MAYDKKSVEVEIVNVDKNDSTISIENDNGNGVFKVVAPANIQFAREGKATVSFNAQNEITYCRMASSGPPKPKEFRKPFVPTEKIGGPSKFKSANSYPQRFNKPEEAPFHYEADIKVLTGVTLVEYEKLYNHLSKTEWITASQVMPTGKEDTSGNRLYDCVIYKKLKVSGAREEPEKPSQTKETIYM